MSMAALYKHEIEYYYVAVEMVGHAFIKGAAVLWVRVQVISIATGALKHCVVDRRIPSVNENENK